MAQTQSEYSILLCLDFDTALTNTTDVKHLFTPFFKSLMCDPSNDYKCGPFKDDKKIQDIFKEKFGEEYYSDRENNLLITPGARSFLEEALRHPTVFINIITTINRSDFIRHVLRYQGFSEEDISRISINDTEDSYIATQKLVNTYNPRFAIICEDNNYNARRMVTALQEHGVIQKNIALYTKDPVQSSRYQFDWSIIDEKLQKYSKEANMSYESSAQAATSETSALIDSSISDNEDFFVLPNRPNDNSNHLDLTEGRPIFQSSEFLPKAHAVVTPHSDGEGYELIGGISVGPNINQNKNKFFTPKVIIPAILCVGFAAGAITTGLVGVHLAAPIVLGVLAALAAILAISMLVRQTPNTYTQI